MLTNGHDRLFVLMISIFSFNIYPSTPVYLNLCHTSCLQLFATPATILMSPYHLFVTYLRFFFTLEVVMTVSWF